MSGSLLRADGVAVIWAWTEPSPGMGFPAHMCTQSNQTQRPNKRRMEHGTGPTVSQRRAETSLRNIPKETM